MIAQQIIKQTAGNLYWKDLEGRYLGCNVNFARILGYASPDAIIGKTEFDFLEPALASLIVKTDKEVMETGRNITLEERGLDEHGKVAFYLSTKTPLLDENRSVIGVIGSSIDITKQQQAKIAKQEFIENMSHDLRTPFVGILSLSEYLHDKETDPDKKEFLGEILKSGRWLLTLLNEVLEVSMLGSHQLNLTEFELSEMVQAISDLLRAEVRHKGLEMNISCPKVTIHSDKMRISRILLNLIGNAVKYTQKGSISINVFIDPQLKIIITDTGAGIPADALESIFERFSKLRPSYQEQYFNGVGIGLHVAREFAHDLGGDITVQSELGVGSTFIFSVSL